MADSPERKAVDCPWLVAYHSLLRNTAAENQFRRRSRSPPPKGTLGKLPSPIVANVPPIMPDVTVVMSNIAAVGPQISLVISDVAPLGARSSVVAVSQVVAQFAPILANVTLVPVDITAVLAPVNSIVPQISTVAAQVAILAQRKRRSQHCKHHQT